MIINKNKAYHRNITVANTYEDVDIFSSRVKIQHVTKSKEMSLRQLVDHYTYLVHEVARYCVEHGLKPRQYLPATMHITQHVDSNTRKSIIKEVKRRLKSKFVQNLTKDESTFEFIEKFDQLSKTPKKMKKSISLYSKSFKIFKRKDDFFHWVQIRINDTKINIPIKENKNIKRFELNKKMKRLRFIRLEVNKNDELFVTLHYTKDKMKERDDSRPLFRNGEIISTTKEVGLMNQDMLCKNKREFNKLLQILPKYIRDKRIKKLKFEIRDKDFKFISKQLRYLYYLIRCKNENFKFDIKKLFAIFLKKYTRFRRNLEMFLRMLRSHGVSYDIEALQMSNFKCYDSHYKPVINPFKRYIEGNYLLAWK